MAKVTQRDMFEGILTVLDGETARGKDVSDLVDFVVGRIEALDKKAGAPKGMTKDQIANEGIKRDIVMILDGPDGVGNNAMTATEIGKTLSISTQKATALITQLVKDGFVERIVEGKTVTFAAK